MRTKPTEVTHALASFRLRVEAPADPVSDGLQSAIVTARNVLSEQSPLVSELERLAELHRRREEFRRHRINQIYGHITDEELIKLGCGPTFIQTGRVSAPGAGSHRAGRRCKRWLQHRGFTTQQGPRGHAPVRSRQILLRVTEHSRTFTPSFIDGRSPRRNPEGTSIRTFMMRAQFCGMSSSSSVRFHAERDISRRLRDHVGIAVVVDAGQ